MSNAVHIHEIMKMMIESGAAYTRDSLRDAIQKTFGEDARFHTCSMDGLSADEAIAFMEMRGKFVPAGEGFAMPPENMCSH